MHYFLQLYAHSAHVNFVFFVCQLLENKMPQYFLL